MPPSTDARANLLASIQGQSVHNLRKVGDGGFLKHVRSAIDLLRRRITTAQAQQRWVRELQLPVLVWVQGPPWQRKAMPHRTWHQRWPQRSTTGKGAWVETALTQTAKTTTGDRVRLFLCILLPAISATQSMPSRRLDLEMPVISDLLNFSRRHLRKAASPHLRKSSIKQRMTLADKSQTHQFPVTSGILSDCRNDLPSLKNSYAMCLLTSMLFAVDFYPGPT